MTTMPAASAARQSADVVPSNPPAGVHPGRWRVLLAEDDREMRELLAEHLTADGYEVLEACDGTELIRRLHEVAMQPQGRASLALVISDVRMPHLDGLDVLAALRCAQWYTPVILITAFGDDAVHRDAHDFGAIAVLDKPFSLAKLQELVHQIAPPSPPTGTPGPAAA